ncbi:MAG: hypothetical protein ACLSIL_10085 [Enterococcus casseliflavus]
MSPDEFDFIEELKLYIGSDENMVAVKRKSYKYFLYADLRLTAISLHTKALKTMPIVFLPNGE